MKAKKSTKPLHAKGDAAGPKIADAIDSAAEFERILKNGAAGQHYMLRLFVTGNTARSAKAIENIHALCEEHLPGRYELEVIDIYQQPNAAVADQIIAAPTLVKELPEPARRLIGDLADPERVMIGLNLARPETIPEKWLKK